MGTDSIIPAVMHADELNTALTEEYGKPIYHYHLHVVAIPVVMKEIKWTKRCKDKSLVLRKCLERLKSWEENPDCPSEISLYYDHAPYSFGFTQHYPDGRTGIVGGLLYHGIPDRSFAVTLQPFHGWQIHT